MDKKDLQFLPISINVTNKKILIIGGGKVATHKATILARFVNSVTVIAPEFTEEIRQLPFTFIVKEYKPGDLNGFFLVYACTGNHDLNKRIKDDAEAAGILTSVCDSPLLCDFISPAIHKEGNITISIGSGGQLVLQSIAIRNQIKELIENGRIHIQ
jgi:siroheme synthase-like protein